MNIFNLSKFAFFIFVLTDGLLTANFVKPCPKHSKFFTKIPSIRPHEASTRI